MKYLNTFSLFNENKQLSQKLYLSTGKISQEDYDKILEITGGDNWTKLVCDFFIKYRWGTHPSDVMELDINQFYGALKEYKNNIFPYGHFDYLNVHLESLCNALIYRIEILKLFETLPSEALRNIKSDKKEPRGVQDMKYYYGKLQEFCDLYDKSVRTKTTELQNLINRKLFKSGIDLNELYKFLEGKKNLLDEIEFSRDKAYELVKRDDIDLVFEKGDILIVRVCSYEAMLEIGCNSLWCFSYDSEEGKRFWRGYSIGLNDYGFGYVYVVIDFKKNSNSSKFMHVILTKGSGLSSVTARPLAYLDYWVYDMMNERLDGAGSFFEKIFGADWKEKYQDILPYE